MATVNNFLSLLDGNPSSSYSFGNTGTNSTGDAFNVTANTNGIAATIVNNSTTTNTIISVNAQILPEGFGSYLDGILPSDIATSAGAFSATMQQVKNIRKIEIEKLAQVVANLETTQGLPLVNGTNIPTDAVEAQAALSLVALGTGPKGTYTFSDLFGCMSGLPYGWANLQSAISTMPTGNLSTIYSNLYAATQGPSLGLDAAVQAQIDLANAEIAVILTTHPGQSTELNDLYNATATQLAIEQLTRETGLAAIPSPRISGRPGDLFPYPLMIYSFTDLLPNYAILTAPNLAAQNLEAISDLTLLAGQSIVALMREVRNQVRLAEVGIDLDNNIPDVTPFINIIVSPPDSCVAAVLAGVPGPDIGIGTLGICQVAITGPFFDVGVPGGPIVPGSLAGSPYTNLIPLVNTVLPSAISVEQAIEQVITCNCDCWLQ